jgi:hypothetical protein
VRLRACALASTALMALWACGNPPADGVALPAAAQAAVFAWQPFTRTPAQAWPKLIESLREAGITTVYLAIERYADLYEAPAGRMRGMALARFTADLRAVVATASDEGMTVHALAGNPRWGDADYRYLPLVLVRYVRRYNAAAGARERLAGINFDIEPYAQPGFARRPEKVLGEYLETVARLARATARRPAISLGLEIPSWFFRHGPGPHRRLCVRSGCKPVGEHALDALSENARSYAVVMAYRSFTNGPNGSLALAAPAFAYVAANRLPVGLRVGQETQPADSAHVSFAGRDRRALVSAITRIVRAFAPEPSFRGVTINDLEGLMGL